MMTLSGKRILVLLLGIWVALAPALTVSQATAVALEQGISNDASACAGDCCSGEEMERGACMSSCFNAAQHAIAGSVSGPKSAARLRQKPPLMDIAPAACSPPEPAPPKLFFPL